MELELLEIIENNSRINTKDVAFMLGMTQEEVTKMIIKLEEEQVICGYSTLINWDKTERSKELVTALIEVRVTPQRDEGFDKIAKNIYNFDQVQSVYLISGSYDLMVIVEGKNIRDISHFVSSKLSTFDNIISTATHFVLKKYKEHGIILEKSKKDYNRRIISP